MSDAIDDYVTAQRALIEIGNLHLPIPRQVSDEEKLTAEGFQDETVADLNDQQLMRYLGLFTGFQAFAEWEVAKADVNHTCSSSTHVFVLSDILLSAPDYNSVKEKEAWSRKQPQMIAAEASSLRTEAKLTLLKALAKAYEKKSALCSRELTRRMAQGAQALQTSRFQS